MAIRKIEQKVRNSGIAELSFRIVFWFQYLKTLNDLKIFIKFFFGCSPKEIIVFE